MLFKVLQSALTHRAYTVALATLVAASVSGCGGDTTEEATTPNGVPESALPATPQKADSVDPSDNLRSEEVERIHNHPRFVLRDRLDLAGRPVVERPSTPFSHRSRRWHVYPFASYGQATYTVELSTEDARMADSAAVWVFGPRGEDGTWNKVAPAIAEDGKVTLEMRTRGYGQYVLVVGPESAKGADGELDWYVPEARSRSTWFISKDGGDLRLGLFNDPYEGTVTLIDPDNPGAEESFHILEAVAGDGRLLSHSGEELMGAALVALVPELHEGKEVTLTKDGSCDVDEETHHCLVAA